MPRLRRFELDELTLRPGTYFNPDTEVLLIVDDTPEIEQAIFDADDGEGGEWVLVSDEAPVDEAERDELLERFQARYRDQSRETGLGDEELEDEDLDDEDDDEDDLDDEELEDEDVEEL
jgi:hypothetical protein